MSRDDQAGAARGDARRRYSIELLERRTLLALAPEGAEFLVHTSTLNDQVRPAVAMDADGDFVVAWSGSGQGDSSGVFAQRFNAAGVPQGTQFLVNTTTTGNQHFPAVSMDSDGDFVVVWRAAGADVELFGRKYNAAGGAQGAEFFIGAFQGLNLDSNWSVAMDADGDFVVVWDDGLGGKILGRRYNSAGVPQGPQFIISNTVGDLRIAPDVAMDGDGDFVVTWTVGYAPGVWRIRGQRYNAAGLAQGGGFTANSNMGVIQRFSSVAMDMDGDFVIAWESQGQDGSGYGIFARYYNSAGVAQGPDFRVNPFTANDQLNADVAMNAAGEFLVTWQSFGQDGSLNGIYARNYGAGGVFPRQDFRVNTTTSGEQITPAAAMHADGNCVIVWESVGDIRAQRYEQNDTVFWTGAAGDNLWTTPANWTSNPLLPGPNNDVAITISGTPTITLNSGAQSIESLFCDELLNISGASTILQVAGVAALTSSGRITLDGGTLTNATVNGDGPVWSTSADGKLDNVTLGTDMRVVAGAVITVLNGLTLQNNHSVSLEGAGLDVSNLSFSGTQTLDGTGSIVFNGSNSLVNNVVPGTTGQTLTIAAGITIRTGTQGGNIGGIGSGAVVNQGTISAQTDLRTINVRVPSTNNGTYEAKSGGRLTVETAPANFSAGTLTGGTWRVFADSTMRLAGTNITTNAATILLDGANSNVYNATAGTTSALTGLASISATGILTLGSGRDLSVTPAGGILNNSGTLKLGAGSTLSIVGGFTQPGSTLNVDIAGPNPATDFGRISATGVVSLNGSLVANLINSYDPAPGTMLPVVVGSSRTGTFSSFSGGPTPSGHPLVALYDATSAIVAVPVQQAPVVTASDFHFATLPQRLTFTFDQNISASFSLDDIIVQTLPGGPTITPSGFSYDTQTNTLTVTFGGVLADANYRATLIASGITNSSGTPMGADFVLNFFFLLGDANHDGRVNLNDFNILAANFGQSPRDFSQGDFNYDMVVNLNDFNILAARFGQTLSPGSQNRLGGGIFADDDPDKDELGAGDLAELG